MRSTYVFVNNRPPVVACPSAGTNIGPVTVNMPYVFEYKIDDVSADGSTMAVIWDFGDGSIQTVTGLVGVISHTYASLGDKSASVRAVDKDGSSSVLNQFMANVVPQTVATPTFIPETGATCTNSVFLTISCLTDGATIHYTLDGPVPSVESSVYTGMVTLAESAAVKSIALNQECRTAKSGLLHGVPRTRVAGSSA